MELKKIGPFIQEIDIRNVEGKETNLICTHRGLIEMRPKKWPKQTAFILFKQKN